MRRADLNSETEALGKVLIETFNQGLVMHRGTPVRVRCRCLRGRNFIEKTLHAAEDIKPLISTWIIKKSGQSLLKAFILDWLWPFLPRLSGWSKLLDFEVWHGASAIEESPRGDKNMKKHSSRLESTESFVKLLTTKKENRLERRFSTIDLVQNRLR